jgi:hypothetical protein
MTVSETDVHVEERAPVMGAESGLQAVPAGDRAALVAECRALEHRWAELHEEVRRYSAEWQRLLEEISGRVGAGSNGGHPGWADGMLMFVELGVSAQQMAGLAAEAQQVCQHYTTALQQVVSGLPPSHLSPAAQRAAAPDPAAPPGGVRLWRTE